MENTFSRGDTLDTDVQPRPRNPCINDPPRSFRNTEHGNPRKIPNQPILVEEQTERRRANRRVYAIASVHRERNCTNILP